MVQGSRALSGLTWNINRAIEAQARTASLASQCWEAFQSSWHQLASNVLTRGWGSSSVFTTCGASKNSEQLLRVSWKPPSAGWSTVGLTRLASMLGIHASLQIAYIKYLLWVICKPAVSVFISYSKEWVYFCRD